ncbi:exodeoxyribonuclease VII large subunit [Halomonas elongata]|uniref:Exodeoxyribonuclease VII large subunit n=1 Tax=Halomonas elongata TaxID=2746 RepID=A0A1B8NV71_HALEL|nr:exodeoxyribonuclease VII large subunit [Halomonas elongata]OBX33914.1 exodeoxyribonuclease VII large subunit [Halomonas elongata]
MDRKSLNEGNINISTITPDNLVDLLKFERPTDPISIQGIAQNVTPWTNGRASYVYGRLVLGVASVGFRTLPEFAPQEGEAVTIEGTLYIAPANKANEDRRATFQVILRGKVVGTWRPRPPVEPIQELPTRDALVSLDDFISSNDLADLTILVSGTAQADITRMLSDEGLKDRPNFVEVNFGNREKFLSKLRELNMRRGVHGFAIARGGGGGQKLIGDSREIISELITVKKPFYVAIGHATDLSLIDHHADQSFHSPSGLGAAIARAAKSVAHRRERDRELVENKRKVQQLTERLHTLEDQLQRSSSSRRRTALFSWSLVAAITLLQGLSIAWVFDLLPNMPFFIR